MSEFRIEGSKLDGRYYDDRKVIVPSIGDHFEDDCTVVKVIKRTINAHGTITLKCQDTKAE